MKTHHSITYQVLGNAGDTPSIRWHGLSTYHDHHSLTGAPFSENNTATPTTLTTLATPVSNPPANFVNSLVTPTTPTTLTILTTPADLLQASPTPLLLPLLLLLSLLLLVWTILTRVSP